MARGTEEGVAVVIAAASLAASAVAAAVCLVGRTVAVEEAVHTEKEMSEVAGQEVAAARGAGWVTS